MADFCLQCCKDILGVPDGLNDLKGLSSVEDNEKGLFSEVVICEGCGPIQVDCDGASLLSPNRIRSISSSPGTT